MQTERVELLSSKTEASDVALEPEYLEPSERDADEPGLTDDDIPL